MTTAPLTEQLIEVVDAYCIAAKLSRSRVSTLIYGDGMRLDGIAQGKDLHTRSFERAMLWLSTNWPEAAGWPANVARPDPFAPADLGEGAAA